ncbi:uncharacterized protein LOC123879095 [Maniola jurtina]|uniref:uncharacterized protein LOC123879095 n=1 Tax=Maniola jurtina TaxID=191418 RepID=UPI001E686815|nr:uncharacterized protein LOC123879095 [Maniola jurtina]
MKAVLLFVFGVSALQSAFAQCIASAPVIAPVCQPNNVGVKLADTLSLLTVSSLLAEKLPFDYPCGCTPYVPPCNTPCGPYFPTYAPIEIAPIVNTCGCGYNGYNYPYNAYVL